MLPIKLRFFKRLRSLVHSFYRTKLALLWAEPLIILSPYGAQRSYPLYQLNRFASRFSDRSVHFICYINGYLSKIDLVRMRKHVEEVKRHAGIKPHFHLMANTEEQRAEIAATGFGGFYCSKNALIDERLFYVGSTPKLWDAVYDARLVPVKRHFLASKVQNLALLTPPHSLRFRYYARGVVQKLSQATFINNPFYSDYRSLGAEEVALVLKQSRVGLCLSAREGAMRASIQYLFAGLPVVTTKNVGGRMEFLDSSNSLVVSDSPEAVAEGVREMIARQCDGESIRQQAIGRIWEHRRRLLAYIEQIIPNCETGALEKRWEELFFSKMVKEEDLYSLVK